MSSHAREPVGGIGNFPRTHKFSSHPPAGSVELGQLVNWFGQDGAMEFEIWEGLDPEETDGEWKVMHRTVLGPRQSRQGLEPWMRMTGTVEAESLEEAFHLARERMGNAGQS